MGGSSSSRSSETTNIQTQTSDYSGADVGRDIIGLTAGDSIENVSLEQTDFGAVMESFDFARDVGAESLRLADSTTGRALDEVASLAGTQSHVQQGMVDKVGDLARQFQSEGRTEQLKLVGFVAAGVLVTVVAVAFVTSGGGKK